MDRRHTTSLHCKRRRRKEKGGRLTAMKADDARNQGLFFDFPSHRQPSSALLVSSSDTDTTSIVASSRRGFSRKRGQRGQAPVFVGKGAILTGFESVESRRERGDIVKEAQDADRGRVVDRRLAGQPERLSESPLVV